jgi:hypothetical protein
MFLLIGFPFFLHFGSNVYFLRLAIHYWVFWLLSLMILMEGRPKLRTLIYERILPFASVLLVLNGVALYSFGGYQFFQKTNHWEYRKGKSILLPADQVTILEDIQKRLDSSSTTQPLAIFHNPGTLYLLGYTHPYTPGIWSPNQLHYYFNNDDNLNTILYNRAYDFPYQEENWKVEKSYHLSQNEFLDLYRKSK